MTIKFVVARFWVESVSEPEEEGRKVGEPELSIGPLNTVWRVEEENPIEGLVKVDKEEAPDALRVVVEIPPLKEERPEVTDKPLLIEAPAEAVREPAKVEVPADTVRPPLRVVDEVTEREPDNIEDPADTLSPLFSVARPAKVLVEETDKVPVIAVFFNAVVPVPTLIAVAAPLNVAWPLTVNVVETVRELRVEELDALIVEVLIPPDKVAVPLQLIVLAVTPLLKIALAVLTVTPVRVVPAETESVPVIAVFFNATVPVETEIAVAAPLKVAWPPTVRVDEVLRVVAEISANEEEPDTERVEEIIVAAKFEVPAALRDWTETEPVGTLIAVATPLKVAWPPTLSVVEAEILVVLIPPLSVAAPVTCRAPVKLVVPEVTDSPLLILAPAEAVKAAADFVAPADTWSPLLRVAREETESAATLVVPEATVNPPFRVAKPVKLVVEVTDKVPVIPVFFNAVDPVPTLIAVAGPLKFACPPIVRVEEVVRVVAEISANEEEPETVIEFVLIPEVINPPLRLAVLVTDNNPFTVKLSVKVDFNVVEPVRTDKAVPELENVPVPETFRAPLTKREFVTDKELIVRIPEPDELIVLVNIPVVKLARPDEIRDWIETEPIGTLIAVEAPLKVAWPPTLRVEEILRVVEEISVNEEFPITERDEEIITEPRLEFPLTEIPLLKLAKPEELIVEADIEENIELPVTEISFAIIVETLTELKFEGPLTFKVFIRAELVTILFDEILFEIILFDEILVEIILLDEILFDKILFDRILFDKILFTVIFENSEIPLTVKFPFVCNELIEVIEFAMIESFTFNLKIFGSISVGDPPFHCWSRLEISSSSLWVRI